MGVHDFTETVSCFMRVAWAAAAGKLHLLSSPQPIRESATAYSCGRRSRQSSTGKQSTRIFPKQQKFRLTKIEGIARKCL